MRNPFLSTLLILASVVYAEEPPQSDRFLANERQLIYEGKRSGEGYFSTDGAKLIFQSERDDANPFYQIFTLDFESGDTARVSPGMGKTTCSFFVPGTKRVIFASTHHDPEALTKQKAELDFRASGKTRRYSWDYDPAMDIFSANADGTGIIQLTNARGYDAEGSVSPDGKKIVFCSLRSAYDHELNAEEKSLLEKDAAWFGEIYIMNADGSDQRRLTNAPGYDGGPFFSPDGQRIIWRRFDASGMNADVFTMKLDGSDVSRLTDFKAMSWAPYFHPTGDYVIFTSNKLGFENFELFVVDAAGAKEPVRVTFTPGFDGLPVFSPDGNKLCWTTNRGTEGKSQLWFANWDDAAARKALADSPPRSAATAEAKKPTPQAPVFEKGLLAPPRAVNELTSQLTSAISADDLRAEVTWLADPARDGRLTGTDGAKAASQMLAEYYKKIGLQPVGDSFFLPFDFNAGEKLGGDNSMVLTRSEGGSNDPKTVAVAVTTEAPYKVERDFRPLAFTENGSTEGEVVFAGYGLSVPEGGTTAEGGANARYNSYDGLDVKDKIVLVLRYVPEAVDPPRRAQLNRYAGLRYKAMLARERGARAVLFVNGPNSPGAGELVPLAGDGAFSSSGVLCASVSGAVADALLAPSGKALKDLQAGLDTENPHAEGGFVIPKMRVKLSCTVEHVKKADRDVVAAIQPNGTGEYLLIGAHYDHLGRGIGGNSMARSGEEGQVHPGADDNGSGTAVLMELAASLAKERAEHPEKFHRGVIFASWSGEELGLIGSAAFVEHPPLPLEKIAAYVNFDMVGRMRDNKLTVQGVGSSKLWPKLLEKRNVAAGFNLVLQNDPYLPTDTTSFYPKRMPVLNFFTGAHEDYHRPTDTAEKLDYEATVRVANFARSLILDLAAAPERPDFARVERSDAPGGSRETLRAYLGSIPDYTTEVKGVKLSGVRGGSPAEKGGLASGDIIIEFGGQKIANIYDYTYALDAVKIGTPVKVAVERGGKRVEMMVTPEARK